MRTQFDHIVRVVALSNLEAMCQRISGVCHKFEVVKCGPNTCHVQYSNPDEYGSPEPITAVYPCYKAHDGFAVVLEASKYHGCTGKNEEAWQAFSQLTDCPQLWNKGPDSSDWATTYEIMVERHPAFKVTSTWDKGGCIQTWSCKDMPFKSFPEATDYAVEQMRLADEANRNQLGKQ